VWSISRGALRSRVDLSRNITFALRKWWRERHAEGRKSKNIRSKRRKWNRRTQTKETGKVKWQERLSSRCHSFFFVLCTYVLSSRDASSVQPRILHALDRGLNHGKYRRLYVKWSACLQPPGQRHQDRALIHLKFKDWRSIMLKQIVSSRNYDVLVQIFSYICIKICYFSTV
jgi:hypothetical protein